MLLPQANTSRKFFQAIDLFHQSIESQSEWRQFHHLCYWELAFCYAFNGQWSKAAEYAQKLYKENRWSRATYAYMTAIFVLADEKNAKVEKERIRRLLE